MLSIEPICDDLIAFLQARLPAQLDTVVAAMGTRHPVTAPRTSSYYLGEWHRFRPMQLPAVFIVPSRSVLSVRTADEGANIDKWQHQLLLDVLCEGAEEESLTRCCYRYAEAFYATLHDQDITRAGISTRGTQVFVSAVDYGPMIAKPAGGGPFKKDVFLTLNVLHYDRSTPVG